MVTPRVESWLSEMTEDVLITLKPTHTHARIFINRLSLSAAGMSGQDTCSAGAGDGPGSATRTSTRLVRVLDQIKKQKETA